MGLFSWTCPGCDHSIRHPASTNRTSAWMADAVVVFPNGDKISGTYDGYGRIGSTELEYGQDFAMHHRACWEISGRPAYKKPSETAHDQGHFVGEYDPIKPETEADLARLKSRTGGT